MPPTPLLSKREQMLQVLRDALTGGAYEPGACLPSESVLSERYGVSKNTIREAVSVLVQEGYLQRRQGKGTFVLRPAAPEHAVKCYALFIQASGDLYYTQSRTLVRCIQERQAIPMVFDLGGPSSDTSLTQIRGALTNALRRGISGIVTTGATWWIRDTCRQQGVEMPRTMVINDAPADLDAATRAVITDSHAGTRLATQHLIARGHRRILFVIHRNPNLPAGTAPELAGGTYGAICSGYVDALSAGATAQYLFIEHEFFAESDCVHLRQILESRDRPTAVFAYGDFRATNVIRVARELGLSVPGDLAVVGYHNTPWSQNASPPITTVSIEEEVIAQQAAALLLAPEAAWQAAPPVTIIPPRLLVRASCGAPGASAP